MARKFTTDDVVKDAALPEFKPNWSMLGRLVEARRPLRPRRQIVSEARIWEWHV